MIFSALSVWKHVNDVLMAVELSRTTLETMLCPEGTDTKLQFHTLQARIMNT